MNMAVLSLIFLVLVLVLGFWKKVNMGYLAMGAALILGRIGGVADKAIVSSFNTSLFVMLSLSKNGRQHTDAAPSPASPVPAASKFPLHTDNAYGTCTQKEDLPGLGSLR